MMAIGPETAEDQALREWFDDQERRNIDRIDAGAKTIIQLVSAMYSVMFAVLALNAQPAYLQQPWVRLLGGLAVLFLFAAMCAALAVVYPFQASYQQYNLSQMRHAQATILSSKVWGARISLVAFLGGMATLAALVLTLLRLP